MIALKRLRIAAALCTVFLIAYVLRQGRHNRFRSHRPRRKAANADGSIRLTFDRELQHRPDIDVAATVKRHILANREIHESLLARQSRTVREAAFLYPREYHGREASSYYHAWTAFALKHNSTIIDDFGQIEARFDPFRSVPADHLRQRIANVFAKHEGVRRGRLRIRSSQIFITQGQPAVLQSINEILAPLNRTTPLPDMDLPLNWDDLPRVLASLGDPTSDAYHSSWIEAKDRLKSAQKDCLPNSHLTDSLQSKDRPSVDICDADASLAHQHGYFAEAMGQVNTLVPFASFAGLSTSTDILVPHVCYGNVNYRAWDEQDPRTPFEKRRPSVFWRGSATGMVARVSTWRNGHRQRFVGLMQAMQRFTHSIEQGQADASEVSQLFAEPLRAVELNSLRRLPSTMFNVSFTAYHSCEVDPEACVQMQEHMPISATLPSHATYDHKYLFDIDGNSQSCRFYRLLETESLVFKQTIWNEWHDDRIVPWVHYIPISSSYREVPVLLDYFHNHREGRVFAGEIARAGIQLAKTSLRPIDITIYWYRLLVEYADLLVG